MTGVEAFKTTMGLSAMLFESLAEDLRDSPMAVPCDGGNHALWSVGHMAYSEGQFLYMLFDMENPVAQWKDLFDGGTQPSSDASIYPTYDEVIDRYRELRAQMMARLDELTDADLDKPTPNPPEGFEQFFGTIGNALAALATHPMHHRGQLADARRSLQREPVLA